MPFTKKYEETYVVKVDCCDWSALFLHKTPQEFQLYTSREILKKSWKFWTRTQKSHNFHLMSLNVLEDGETVFELLCFQLG